MIPSAYGKNLTILPVREEMTITRERRRSIQNPRVEKDLMICHPMDIPEDD